MSASRSFIAYAAGMGLVVGTVAVAVALARDAIVRGIRRSGQWVPRLSGLLLVLAGAYVAYYGWWEITEGPATRPGDQHGLRHPANPGRMGPAIHAEPLTN